MRLLKPLLLSTISAALLAGCATTSHQQSRYPATRTTNQIDAYHGVKVADPYRWLEDDNAAETKAWVEEQNKVTFAYLDKIPQRDAIRARMTKLWNFERYSTPYERGGRYFFSKNDGLQNQSVIYTMTSLDAPPTVLLDPNKLSKDGTVALSGMAISDDGKLMAYGLSKAGSDWQEWKVRDIATATDLADDIQWVKFSGASWTKDGRGFYYSRYDAPKPGDALKGVNKFQKLYFHKVGAYQSTDELVYERPDKPDWGFGGSVTDDGRYLIVTVSEGTDPRNRVFYKDLDRPDSKMVELLNEFDADYGFIDNRGPIFYFRTDKGAPRYRVLAVDTRETEPKQWREIIPQTSNTLQGVSVIGGSFICEYLQDAKSLVKIAKLDTGADSIYGKAIHPRDLPLPGIGTAGGFSGKATDTHTFYSFNSFTQPGTIYRLEVATGKSTLWKKAAVDFESSNYETRQVFYKSKDGTRIPMFITHKRGLQ